MDSLVSWDQAPWRGKTEKNGERSGLSNDNERESLNSPSPPLHIFFFTMHPLKIFNWPFSPKIDFVTCLHAYSLCTVQSQPITFSTNNAAN